MKMNPTIYNAQHCFFLHLSRRMVTVVEINRFISSSSTATTKLPPPPSSPETSGKPSFVTTTKTKCCTRDHDIITGTIPIGGNRICKGQFAQIQRIFTPDEVHQFGQLIGDLNPIHSTDNISELERHSRQMVHGMLSASLFSCIFGTLIPGSIYRNQSMIFQSPIYSNEKVMGVVTVTKVRNMKRRGTMVSCDTHVYKNFDEDVTKNSSSTAMQGFFLGDHVIKCISGEATVWIPSFETSP